MLAQKKSEPDEKLFNVSNKSLLDYVHTLDGGNFKTKDFRTLLGTRTAMNEMSSMKAPTTEKEYKKAVLSVAKTVSSTLGNTPSVALKSYISPVVFAPWQSAVHGL